METASKPLALYIPSAKSRESLCEESQFMSPTDISLHYKVDLQDVDVDEDMFCR